MNCDQFQALIGMRCEPVPMRSGGSAVAVVSPFTYFDGDGVELFAQANGPQVHFFDDGAAMDWLHSLGLPLGDDRRRWAAVRKAVKPYAVSLADDGCLELYAPADSACRGFAQMISAALAVDAWAREAAGMPMESNWLLEEAAMYLRAWRPQVPLIEQPEGLLGLSGKTHTFDFRLGDELIDAISPSPNASGHELRKLVDVRAYAGNQGQAVRVLIDDRRDAAAAMVEASILGNFATAWPISRLIGAGQAH